MGSTISNSPQETLLKYKKILKTTWSNLEAAWSNLTQNTQAVYCKTKPEVQSNTSIENS